MPGGLSFGSQTITVSYSGDTTYATSTTNATLNILNDSLRLQYNSQTLANSPFAVNVQIAMLSPPTSGNTVSAAAAPAPTGSLTLSEGSTVLATIPDLTQATPTSAGYFTLTATSLPPGAQTLKVTYNGDSNYSANRASFGVNALSTLATSVSSSYSTSVYVGQAYTVNAAIYGTLSLGVPRTGTLSLVEGSNTLASVNIATATPNTNGSFALTVPGGLSLGANGLQVVYSGDTNYTGSSQTLQTVTARLNPDSVSLSYTTPIAGAPLTINAKINGTVLAGVARTGTLTLTEGSSQLAQVDITTATPNASGYYALSVPGGLSFGSQTLTVTYSGDGTYATSSANATLNIVNDSLKLQYNGQTLANSPFAINVAIAPQTPPSSGATATAAVAATPTGSLTLMQGTTVLATIPDLTQATPSLTGYYTLTDTAGLPLGSQSLKIVYSGDSNYSANTVGFGLTVVSSLATSVSSSYPTSAYVGMPYTVNAGIYGTVSLRSRAHGYPVARRCQRQHVGQREHRHRHAQHQRHVCLDRVGWPAARGEYRPASGLQRRYQLHRIVSDLEDGHGESDPRFDLAELRNPPIESAPDSQRAHQWHRARHDTAHRHAHAQ